MPKPNRFVTARLSFRKGTTSEWAGNDPVLIPGEPAYDTSVNKFKIGDGLKSWTELPYVESTGGPFAWENNEKSLFPEFIQGQDDAINYNKFQHDTLVENAVDLFSAGVTGDPLSVFELSIIAATGGAASIVAGEDKLLILQDFTYGGFIGVKDQIVDVVSWVGDRPYVAKADGQELLPISTKGTHWEISAGFTAFPRHYNAYRDGDTVQINAVTFNPYNFTGWTGLLAGEEDTATTTITMSENRSLTANFSF